MNNLFTANSSSFLLIMLIIFGVSALIKFAIRLFEMLIKLAFILILIFLGFKALELDETPPPQYNNPSPATLDTINKPKADTLKMVNSLVYGLKPPIKRLNNMH